ncbi:MAG TPA: electron transport complex subunit RsxG, partial [Alcanivorax sp.]|nr:electron transport complex subunit RsxG [Alcanivorax sp.]
ARRDGAPGGAVLEATAPDGYGGAINLIVGVDMDGRVLGVRAVPPHNETPGLGDKIERRKSDWILSFNGKSLDNPAPDGWAVKKDGGRFDSFTGATITPRAVVTAVHRALRYFNAHRDDLFAAPALPHNTETCDG